MTEDRILKALMGIVGEDYASNRAEELYIYSVDSGTEGPRKVDYVAMPRTTEEVRRIVLLANEHRVPITPMGANLTLNGLGLPVNGGIVLDMKRMDSIIELNRPARYVVVEPGVTQGRLGSYLEKNCPDLEHSRPEAPPMATVVGNTVIRGHGYLAVKYGNNAHLINGMEVVLPTGEICNIGARSVSPWPFCKGPLPDLAGLFCGWNGTTGVITQLSLKLFPKRKMLDVVGYAVPDVKLLPDMLYRITHTDMVENLFVVSFAMIGIEALPQYVTVCITGDIEEEMEYKRAIFRRIAEEFGSEQGKLEFLYPVPDPIKERFVEKPPYVSPALAADFERGGGYRYCGAILPVEKMPEAFEKGVELAHGLGMSFLNGTQIMGYCHSCNFCFVYPFNRADEESVERCRRAMHATNEMVLEMGGIPWKAEVAAQRQIVARMDPNTFGLMNRIWNALDPNGIMNPGNWSKGDDLN